MVWAKSRPGFLVDYGAGSRGLSVGGAWPLDWVREGGTGKARRTLVETLSLLPFAERSYEAFALATSPAYRSDYPCYRHGSYDINNTKVTQMYNII